MVKIYYLESDGKIFYIGKTKNNLFLRVGKHREKFSNKYNNIKILLLDEVKEKEWKFWEQYWIEQFKSWGFHLENQNKGGGGPEKHKPESLRKMSENMKGRKLSKETISKIVQANTGRKNTEESKLKMSLSKKGKCWHKPHNEETREKLRKAKLGNQYKKGYIHSEESRQKMAIAKTGNTYALGYKHSEESLKKMRKPKNHGDKVGKAHEKPVLQYDKNMNFIKEFKSIKQAMNETGVNNSIGNCCSGKLKTCGGFIWRFK